MKFKRSAFGYNTTDVEDYIDELSERHEVELEHKDIEIRKLKSTIEQLQQRADDLDEASQRILELEGINAQLTGKLSEGAQFSSEFSRLKSDFQAMDNLLREKEQRLQEALAEAVEIRNRAADLPRLETLLAEKDRLLNQAEVEMQASRRDLESIETLRTALDERESVISEMKDRIDALERELEGAASRQPAYTEAAPTAEPVQATGIAAYQTPTAPVDEFTSYLTNLTIEAGSAVIQRNTPEYERFRRTTMALRQHLGNLTTELATYRQQEKAIAQALVQAQLKAVEIEAEALSDTLRKKTEITAELEASMVELELTKKTTNKFKADMANVIDAYKQRLTNFGLPDTLPPIGEPDGTENE